jgi:glyoxalase family protein
MPAETSGLHHVTAIGGAPQRNIDFYITGLGLRLVKRTVNFDSPARTTSTTATKPAAPVRS